MQTANTCHSTVQQYLDLYKINRFLYILFIKGRAFINICDTCILQISETLRLKMFFDVHVSALTLDSGPKIYFVEVYLYIYSEIRYEIGFYEYDTCSTVHSLFSTIIEVPTLMLNPILYLDL